MMVFTSMLYDCMHSKFSLRPCFILLPYDWQCRLCMQGVLISHFAECTPWTCHSFAIFHSDFESVMATVPMFALELSLIPFGYI